MNRKRMAWLLALTPALAMGGLLVAQDDRPQVHDLTEGEVTEQRLIDALRPAEDPPAELLGTPRGIGVASRPRLKCSFHEKSKSRGIAVRPRPAKNVAQMKILFAFNSAQILPDVNPGLEDLGRALKSDPLALCCFRIVGHTDNVGSDAYNDRLSRMRAESVVRYLTQRHGIDAGRLEAMGYGKQKPAADNSTEAGRSKNRRVEIETISYAQAEM